MKYCFYRGFNEIKILKYKQKSTKTVSEIAHFAFEISSYGVNIFNFDVIWSKFQIILDATSVPF